MTNMRRDTPPASGFITMIVMMLAIFVAVVVLVYLRISHLHQ